MLKVLPKDLNFLCLVFIVKAEVHARTVHEGPMGE